MKRSQNAVTPVRALSSVKRWLAASVKSFDGPGHSMTTAPSAPQLSTSRPACKRLKTSATRSSKSRAGSRLRSSQPAAAVSPNSTAEKSGLIHRTGFAAAIRLQSAAVKPVAAASWPGSAKISCSAPRRRPPCRQASASAWPSGTHSGFFDNSTPAVLARSPLSVAILALGSLMQASAQERATAWR